LSLYTTGKHKKGKGWKVSPGGKRGEKAIHSLENVLKLKRGGKTGVEKRGKRLTGKESPVLFLVRGGEKAEDCRGEKGHNTTS